MSPTFKFELYWEDGWQVAVHPQDRDEGIYGRAETISAAMALVERIMVREAEAYHLA